MQVLLSRAHHLHLPPDLGSPKVGLEILSFAPSCSAVSFGTEVLSSLGTPVQRPRTRCLNASTCETRGHVQEEAWQQTPEGCPAPCRADSRLLPFSWELLVLELGTGSRRRLSIGGSAPADPAAHPQHPFRQGAVSHAEETALKKRGAERSPAGNQSGCQPSVVARRCFQTCLLFAPGFKMHKGPVQLEASPASLHIPYSAIRSRVNQRCC